MGRSKSVFNKRSQDRVASSVKSQPTKHVTQSAHAQPAPNPTTNRSVQSQPQQDPWARASQFAQNVGRGAGDTARSYTTDIADSITGNYQERKMKDQTLSDVFITGAMEGRLDDSWGEIGRRVTQEPGRVVGEAAVEAGFLIGTMGIGAAAKGVKIGATGVKVIRAADKSKGAVGFQRKTGIIKKGKEIKFIGDKTTETQKWSQKKGWTTKISKTKWTDRIERRATPLGGRITNNVKYAAPMVRGASEVNYAGYMKQYEQFQAGNLGHISGVTKLSGLFKGIAAPARSPTKGVIEFDTQVPRIGGTPDNFSNLKTAAFDSTKVDPPSYIGKDGQYYTQKLTEETRPIANKLIKEFNIKIKNDKSLKAARERATVVDMKDTREVLTGGSPNSIPIDKNVVMRMAKAQIIQTISEGGTEAQATSKVNKIIKDYTSQTIKHDTQVSKETTSMLTPLGSPTDDIGTSMTRFNIVEEVRPNVITDKDGGLVKIKYNSEPGPIVFGENFGTYGKTAGAFDDSNQVMREMGGALETGGAKIKNELNVGSQMANRYDTAAQYRSSLNFFTVAQRKQYNVIRTAKPGKPSALASQELRSSLPPTLEGYMQGSVGQKGLTMSETQNMLYVAGYGGGKELAQKEASSINTLFGGIRTPFSNVKPSKTNPVTAQQIRVKKQEAFIKGDTSIISPYETGTSKYTTQQITETGVRPKSFVKEQNKRITSPGYYDSITGRFIQEDVTSILTSIQFEGGRIGNRIPGARKSSMGRTPYSIPKTMIDMDERRVGFQLRNVRNTVQSIGTVQARKRVGKAAKTRGVGIGARGKKKAKKYNNQDLINFQWGEIKSKGRRYTW